MKVLTLTAALGLSALALPYTYMYDDGVSDNNLTTGGPATYNAFFANQYTTVAGGEVIGAISVVWGSRLNPNLPNGLVADVLLLSDPNNDGNTSDAGILSSFTTVTMNVGTDTFNTYPIVPVTLAPGQNFFAAAFIHDAPNNSTWAGFDTNATGRASQAWWNVAVQNPIGNSDLTLSIFGFQDATWMIRAEAVPEPATLAAVGLGVAAFLRRRRK